MIIDKQTLTAINIAKMPTKSSTQLLGTEGGDSLMSHAPTPPSLATVWRMLTIHKKQHWEGNREGMECGKLWLIGMSSAPISGCDYHGVL